jgi:Protein of unknown function (DUF2637)
VSTRHPDRTENIVQILIVLAIGGMAGAASFTHVHDWTMHNVPAGTSGWFGWANAIISELTPTAAGLEIRRRKRANGSITYPATVLVLAAALSLTAQVADATPSITGWIVAAVPALAFLALTKLVLSRTPAHQPTRHADTRHNKSIHAHPETDPGPAASQPLPPELLTGARMAAFTHQQATGQPITTDTLADHLAIPPALAGQLLHALGDTGTTGTPSPVTAMNGTDPSSGSRP